MTTEFKPNEVVHLQVWLGEELHQLDDRAHRTIDVADIHAAFPAATVRIIARDRDYCEVFPPTGPIRRGTLARTTLVRIQEEGRS